MIQGGKAGEDGTLTASQGGTLFSPQTLGNISVTKHVSNTNCVRSCGDTGIRNRNEIGEISELQEKGAKQKSQIRAKSSSATCWAVTG